MTTLEDAEKDLQACEKRVAKAQADMQKAETRLQKELASEALTAEYRRLRSAREYLENCGAAAARDASENVQLSHHNQITRLLDEPYEIARAVYRAECVVNALRQKCLEALQPYASVTNGNLPPLYPGVEAPEDRPRTFADVLRVGAKREGARLPSLLNDMLIMPLGQRWDDWATRQEKYAEHDMAQNDARDRMDRTRPDKKALTDEETSMLRRVMESDLANSPHGLTKLLTGITDVEISRDTFMALAGLVRDLRGDKVKVRPGDDVLSRLEKRLPTLIGVLDAQPGMLRQP